MKIKKLKAKNFWSYREIDFDFDKGLCLVDGYNHDEQGSNGAGKSALFNAVCYGLFGDLPKKIKSDDVINRYSDKECIVDLWIEDNGKKYFIHRGRKPNTLKFSIDDQIQADVDVKQTQKLINKELGFTLDIFLNSVYFSQNSLDFLNLNDEQKKSILTDILDLDIFDKAEKLVKTNLDAQNKKADLIKVECSTLENSKANYQKSLAESQEKSRFFQQDKDTKLAEIQKEKDSVNKSILDSQNKIESLNFELRVFEGKLEAYYLDSRERTNSINQLIDFVQVNNNERVSLEANLIVEKRALSKFDVSHENCPTCFQKTDFKLLEQLKKEQNEKVLTIEAQCNSLKKVLSDLPSLSELNESLRKLNTAEYDFKQSISQTINSIKTIENTIARWNDRLLTLDKYEKDSSKENPYIDFIQKFKQQIGDIENQIKNKSSQMGALSASIEELVFLREVFGNKGIKAYVFDNIVSELNALVNEYLKTLFSSNIQIDFSSQSEDSKGNFKQVFSQKIFVDSQEVSLGSFSGGEQRRISFAINLALSKIVSNRASKNFNVAFFDEVFDGLDYEGKKNAYSLLSEVFINQDQKDCILVIDHTTEFQTMFENMIKVEKRNGISQIIE